MQVLIFKHCCIQNVCTHVYKNAGQEDFSIAAFQSLRMPLCVQTHKYTFIHTLGRVCIPANYTIVSLAFGSQIAQIHISMQTHDCLHTVLTRQIILVCDNILHLFIDHDLHYSFFVTNMVQYFVWNVCCYRSRCSFLSLKYSSSNIFKISEHSKGLESRRWRNTT